MYSDLLYGYVDDGGEDDLDEFNLAEGQGNSDSEKSDSEHQKGGNERKGSTKSLKLSRKLSILGG